MATRLNMVGIPPNIVTQLQLFCNAEGMSYAQSLTYLWLFWRHRQKDEWAAIENAAQRRQEKLTLQEPRPRRKAATP